MGLALLAAVAVTAALGWVLERLIIRPVYGNALMQMLITSVLPPCCRNW
jgi:branched-chain amino acid transport system permease protein